MMLVTLPGSHSHAEVTLGLPHSQKDAQQVADELSAIVPSILMPSLLQQLQSLYAQLFTPQAKSFMSTPPIIMYNEKIIAQLLWQGIIFLYMK